MNVAQPTKTQLKKLTKLAEPFAVKSEYVMLADGSALAVLYEPTGKGDDLAVHHYEKVERNGKAVPVTVQTKESKRQSK